MTMVEQGLLSSAECRAHHSLSCACDLDGEQGFVSSQPHSQGLDVST